MAYVIIGGLATSTFLNMLVVPTLYLKWGWDSEEVWQRQLALESGGLLDWEPAPPFTPEPSPLLGQGNPSPEGEEEVRDEG